MADISIKEVQKRIGSRSIRLFGDPASRNVCIQPVDDHDLALIGREAAELERQCGHKDWCITALYISDWNRELTPWEAAPVFGKEGFGNEAEATLRFIVDEVIPALEKEYPDPKRSYFLGGYSLAGLFALWAACQTDIFSGIAAASPSVWYPGWIEYTKQRLPKVPFVYLSLGKKEEKVKNQVMATVGDAIREQFRLLTETGLHCQLDWNEGNHFADSELRMARGLAWLLGQGRNAF